MKRTDRRAPLAGQLWLPASAGGEPVPENVSTRTLAGCATIYEYEGGCLRIKPRSWGMFQSALRAFGCERDHRDTRRPSQWRQIGAPDCLNHHRIEAHLYVLEQDKRLAAGTVRGYLGNVRTVAKFAARLTGDHAVSDALALARNPAVPDPQPRCPPADAAEVLGALCEHPGEVAIVRLMLQGARPREVFALRVSEYDPRTGVVTITRSRKGATTRKNGHVHHLQAHADPVLRDALAWTLAHHDELFPRFGTRPEGDLLFPFASERWRDQTTEAWRRLLGDRADAYLPPGTGLYALRHLTATRLLEAGVRDIDVAAHLGHRTLRQVSVYARQLRGASGGAEHVAAIAAGLEAAPKAPPPAPGPVVSRTEARSGRPAWPDPMLTRQVPLPAAPVRLVPSEASKGRTFPHTGGALRQPPARLAASRVVVHDEAPDSGEFPLESVPAAPPAPPLAPAPVAAAAGSAPNPRPDDEPADPFADALAYLLRG